MVNFICAMIKDEHQYIEEWIEYHLSIGFNQIHLFEDGGESHADILEKYGDKVVLHVSRCRSVYRQLAVYKTAFNMLKDKCDWLAFIDADEYIRLDERYGNDISNFLRDYIKYPCVHLCWRNIGAGGEMHSCEKGKIQETYKTPFTKRLKCISMVKSIVNTHNMFARVGHVHHMRGSVNTEFRKGEERLYDKAWIDHYFTKSLEDWVFKVKRGQLFDIEYNIQMFFDVNPDMDNKECRDFVDDILSRDTK